MSSSRASLRSLWSWSAVCPAATRSLFSLVRNFFLREKDLSELVSPIACVDFLEILHCNWSSQSVTSIQLDIHVSATGRWSKVVINHLQKTMNIIGHIKCQEVDFLFCVFFFQWPLFHCHRRSLRQIHWIWPSWSPI